MTKPLQSDLEKVFLAVVDGRVGIGIGRISLDKTVQKDDFAAGRIFVRVVTTNM